MAKSLKPGQLEKIINSKIGSINKAFRKELKLIDVPGLIKDLILKGISPVLGAVGRFRQYSSSYIDVIQGKAKYISFKTGKVVRIEPKMLEGENTSFRVVKRGPDKGKVVQGKQKKAKFEKFERGLGVGKRISPVNLKVSGGMLDSLEYRESTGELIAAYDVDGYNLWQLHNDGEGKLPERRLLPNRPGEGFNRRVEQKITEALAKTMGVKAARLKRFAKIKYVIK